MEQTLVDVMLVAGGFFLGSIWSTILFVTAATKFKKGTADG